MTNVERVERDFGSRDSDEQQAFLQQTWCDHCQAADLGMYSPNEYELEGIIFIEGLCVRCHAPVYTELTEDEIEE